MIKYTGTALLSDKSEAELELVKKAGLSPGNTRHSRQSLIDLTHHNNPHPANIDTLDP